MYNFESIRKINMGQNPNSSSSNQFYQNIIRNRAPLHGYINNSHFNRTQIPNSFFPFHLNLTPACSSIDNSLIPLHLNQINPPSCEIKTEIAMGNSLMHRNLLNSTSEILMDNSTEINLQSPARLYAPKNPVSITSSNLYRSTENESSSTSAVKLDLHKLVKNDSTSTSAMKLDLHKLVENDSTSTNAMKLDLHKLVENDSTSTSAMKLDLHKSVENYSTSTSAMKLDLHKLVENDSTSTSAMKLDLHRLVETDSTSTSAVKLDLHRLVENDSSSTSALESSICGSVENDSTFASTVELGLRRSVENDSTSTSVVSITMQESIPELNYMNFCSSLETNEVMLPDCVIKIEDDTFSCSKSENDINNEGYSDMPLISRKQKATYSKPYQFIDTESFDTINNVIVENVFSLKDNEKISNDCHFYKKNLCSRFSKDTYKCNFCSKLFNLKVVLNAHILKDHKTKRFQCHKCLRNFNSKTECKAHFITTHKYANKVRCNYCFKSFKEKFILIEHYGTFHKITVPFWHETQLSNNDNFKTITSKNGLNKPVCPLCRYECRSKINLMRHYSKVHRIHFRAVCIVCSKNCFYFGVLKNHYQHHCHRPFYCCDCKKLFNTMSSFKLHNCKTGIDSGAYSCANCNRTFIGISQLNMHVCGKALGSLQFNDPSKAVGPLIVIVKEVNLQDQIVKMGSFTTQSVAGTDMLSGESKIYKCRLVHYRCHICGKCFKLKHNLVAHSFCHSDKSLSCPICDRVFQDFNLLQKHYLSHIIKPFKCDSCDQGYIFEHSLVKHTFGLKQSRHQSFSCKNCNKLFDDMLQLETHKCDDRLFTCEICRKCYDEERMLILHGFLHLCTKPYVCPVCNKNYTCVYSLCHHYVTHKPEEKRDSEICDQRFVEDRRIQTRFSRVHNENFLRRSTRKKSFSDILDHKTFQENDIFKHLEDEKQMQIDVSTKIQTDSSYVCDVCDKGFNDYEEFLCHIYRSHEKKILSCRKCRKSYSTIVSFQIHKCSQRYEIFKTECKANVCDICNRRFTSEKLKKHLHHFHSKDRLLSCWRCRSSFKTILGFKKHKCLGCSICKRVITSTELKKHESTCKRLKCAFCDLYLPNKAAFIKHTKTHENKIESNQVEMKETDSKEDLDLSKYYTVVTNPRRYVCGTCKKIWYDKECFEKHCIRIHKTDVNDTKVVSSKQQQFSEVNAPYPNSSSNEVFSVICEICHKIFSCPDVFLKHACIKNKKKILKCDVCNLIFNRMQGYTSHIRSHSRSVFKCEICCKHITATGKLKVHISEHLDIRKNKCTICNKAFVRAILLKEHMAIHGNQRHCECKLCDKKYFTNRELHGHYRVKHPESSYKSKKI